MRTAHDGARGASRSRSRLVSEVFGVHVFTKSLEGFHCSVCFRAATQLFKSTERINNVVEKQQRWLTPPI